MLSALLVVYIALREILPNFFALQISVNVISLSKNSPTHTFSFPFLHSTDQLLNDSYVVKTSCFLQFMSYLPLKHPRFTLCSIQIALMGRQGEVLLLLIWQLFVTSGD